MSALPVVFAGVALVFCAAGGFAEPVKPSLAMVSELEQMQRARSALQEDDPRFTTAYKTLIQKANAALKEGPFSATDKTGPVPSGDPHDYISIGPYWWPNPDTEDGLPYIGRDGQRNPQSRDDTFDGARQLRMSGAVRTLSLAYFYSGDERYSEHAASLLRTWFINPKTRMNPHLEYAQGIPGKVTGRGAGTIDTSGWIGMVDLIPLLLESAHWSEQDHAALQEWFRQYNDWLKSSDNGRQAQEGDGNISVWYDAQVMAYALFTGNPELARTQAEQWTRHRIGRHIEPDGSQPVELRRTRSFSYSKYQLEAFTTAARLAERVQLDLWRHEPEEGRSIQSAIDFLLPYVDHDRIESWPHQQISPADPAAFARSVLARAIVAWPQSSRYRKAYLRVLKPEGQATDELLQFPDVLFVIEERRDS